MASAGVDSGDIPSSCYSTPPPKLCFYSLPSLRRPEPPGLATPPLHLPGSIPFLWEEAPGRPKRLLLDDLLDAETNSSSSSRRMIIRGQQQLELPPGMETINKGEEYSPTAVLDGPYSLNEQHAPPEDLEHRKVRITRFRSSRKRRSLANVLSLRTTSHLSWANIYESLKQVVSRRRARKT